MPKMALCIRRDHAPVAFNVPLLGLRAIEHTLGFWHTPTEMADRATCETDESLLQIIPYVVVGDWAPHGGDGMRVFTYNRGGAGEEARLHGALSVGLGGHVDAPPPEGEGLRNWLAQEACRELKEEVGIDAAPTEIIFANAVLCDPSPGVGRVHIGVLCAIRASAARMGAAEAGVIESGQWLTLAELTRADNFNRLEGWSKAAVQYMGRQL
ncbi:hypothetical protein D3C87_848100 [compost metagenome]